MDVKEMNAVVERSVTTVPTATRNMTVTNPTIVITQMASKEYLKILELAEYCRVAQFTLQEFENKILLLVAARNESARLKIEYLTRDKINITNHESLLQAKNELFQYRSELKSNYVAIEKAVKIKKLRYEKLIFSYEIDWQKALGEYASNPIVAELKDIQRTNELIEKDIESQEKLYVSTRIQSSELHQDVKKKFLNKILEFSQAMIQYKKCILQKSHRKGRTQKHLHYTYSFRISRAKNEVPLTPHQGGRMKFSKPIVPAFSKASSFNREDINSFPGIDVSVFDEVMVPTENLESQNEEEELFNFIQDQNVYMDEENPDQEDRSEMTVNDYHHAEDQDESQIHGVRSTKQDVEKVTREENESQYFQPHPPDCLKQRSVQNTTVENWGPVNENMKDCEKKNFKENSLPLTETLKGNNEKIYSEDNIEIHRQTESEKSMSEGSYDNQNIYPRENFEYTYNKTHSVSSEDMPLSGDNTNESFGSPNKIMHTKQTSIFKLREGQETEESKSFGDFFGINNDTNSSKPSIFKLF